MGDELKTTNLDPLLRQAAAETHPRAAFTARLRGELEAKAVRSPTKKPGWKRSLAWARPWLAQAGLVLLMVGLVALAFLLTPHLPGMPAARTGRLPAGTGTPANSGELPAGALARFGRGTITALAAARDGRLAVGSTAGVCVYNSGLSEDWCSWLGGAVRVLFDPSGRYLAAAMPLSGQESQVAILDAANGQVLAVRQFKGSWLWLNPSAGAVAWDPSGAARVVVVDDNARISAWNWQNNRLAWGPVSVPFTVPSGQAVQMNGVDWASGPQGESVLAVGGNSGLALLDGNSGQVKQRLEPTWQVAPVMGIVGMNFSADGRYLAYPYSAGVVVFQMNGWKIENVLLNEAQFPAWRAAWGAEGASPLLALAGTDSIQITGLEKNSKTQSISARDGSPLAWGPDHSLFYVRADGMLGRYTQNQETPAGLEYSTQPQSLAWSGADSLVSAGMGTINQWDARQGRLGRVSQVPTTSYPTLLTLAEDGSRAAYLAAEQNTAQVLVVDTASNRVQARIAPQANSIAEDVIQKAAFSRDAGRLVTATRTGTLAVWNAADGKAEHSYAALPGAHQIDALAISPDGITAAVAWADADSPRLDLWDLERGEKTASLKVSQTIQRLAWSPDGKRIAAAEGLYVSLYNAQTGESLQTLGPEINPSTFGTHLFNPGEINSLAFSPDGKTLAAGGLLVTLWDVKERMAARTLIGHTSQVSSLAFRADGKVLASGSADGTILLWDLGAERLPTAIQSTPTPVQTLPPTPTGTPQTGTVSGILLAGYGLHQPIAGQKIVPVAMSSGKELPAVETEPGGIFTIPNLPAGRIQFAANHLLFEDTIPPEGGTVDVGTLLYPLIHPPSFYNQSPAPVALETLLKEGSQIEQTEGYSDGTWTRPTEAEQREKVWRWAAQEPAILNQGGEPVLQDWFKRSAFLYDSSELFEQSPAGGPDLAQPGEGYRYLLGLWNGPQFQLANPQLFNDQLLQDLLDRKQVQVWLMGYQMDKILQLSDGAGGMHYAVVVHPAPGFQIVQFPGSGGVMQVRVVSDGQEIARLLPDFSVEPLIGPAPTPTSAGQVDLSAYEVSRYTFASPENTWKMEYLRGEVTERSPRREDYNRISAGRVDGTQQWTVEWWSAHGLGEPHTNDFTWQVAAPGYLYYNDVWSPDGCAQPNDTNLRRLNLATGQVETVGPFGANWNGTFRLDAASSNVVYLDGAALKVYNIGSGETKTVSFQPMDAPSWGVEIVLILSQNQGVLLTLASPWPLCGKEPTRQAVVWVDVQQGKSLQQPIPQGMKFSGWSVGGYAALQAANGAGYRMDMRTGKVEPDTSGS